MVNRTFRTIVSCLSDAEELAKSLSDADYQELSINRGGMYVNAQIALEEAIKGCQKTYTIVNEKTGQSYAIGGYTDKGVCWFLTSSYVTTFNKEERKLLRDELCKNRDEALLVHPLLYNFIWAGNPLHIKFTESCGARMGDKRLGNNNEYYVPFEFHIEDFPHLLKQEK